MKVSELAGAQLDYWVAKAEGKAATISHGACWARARLGSINMYSPSTSWVVGGPIIEREKNGFDFDGVAWIAWSERTDVSDNTISGPTPLIASMRAYVASKFGDEVPEEAR